MEMAGQKTIEIIDADKASRSQVETIDRPTRREREDRLSEEEGPTPKKCKQAPNSDNLGLQVPSESWDKELWKRLNPAPVPANHTHNRTKDDLYLSLSRSRGTTFNPDRDSNTFSAPPRRRDKSADPVIRECAWQGDYQHLKEAAHLLVEHDDSEMSRRSPRSIIKRSHSSTQEEIIDVSGDNQQPLDQQEEITVELIVSQSSQEGARLSSRPSASPAPNFHIANPQPQDNGQAVLFSTRLRPNSGRKLQGQSATLDLHTPTKSVSSGNAGSLRSGLPIYEGEEKNTSAKGNERDQKESKESKAPTEKWYACNDIKVYWFTR
jgi:hypothetical protein